MNTIAAIYELNPKRIIERFKMSMKGREQAKVAQQMMADNARPTYEIPPHPFSQQEKI